LQRLVEEAVMFRSGVVGRQMRSRSAVMSTLLLALAAVSCVGAITAQETGFRMSSRDLEEGTFRMEQVYKGMGCVGENRSPDLAWAGVPDGTRSFVLTMFDRDAPTGSGWWHWVVVNIPASTRSIDAGASRTSKMPPGSLETRTDFGPPGYGGPCPPELESPHRYVITLSALRVEKLEVTADSSAAMVGLLTQANALASTTVTATFGR
jgi:Raf kinase inhibitor-like YbhB/YbcL family protein